MGEAAAIRAFACRTHEWCGVSFVSSTGELVWGYVSSASRELSAKRKPPPKLGGGFD